MSIASVLDPRCTIRAVEYCFSKMYSEIEARENVRKVRDAMGEIYEEYVREYQQSNEHSGETHVFNINDQDRSAKDSYSGWNDILSYV